MEVAQLCRVAPDLVGSMGVLCFGDKAMEPGDRFGEYRIVSQLGRGGQGSVFEVEDGLGLRWALKVCHRIPFADQRAEARFKNEAAWVANNLGKIPQTSGVFVGEHYGLMADRFYIKMRLLQGQSLAARLAGGVRLSLREGVALATSIAQAVGVAHEFGALHRDLKPENIWIEPSGRVLVLDWGCLQILESSYALATMPFAPMCTPGYAAPEQFQAPRVNLTPAVDVYSLGIILYEMLTGVHPFLGESRAVRERSPEGLNAAGKTQPAGYQAATPRVFEPERAFAVNAGSASVDCDALQRASDPFATERMQSPEVRASASPPTRSASVQFGRVRTPDVLRLQLSVKPCTIAGVPRELNQLLERMLAKVGAERPQSMSRVQSELGKLSTAATIGWAEADESGIREHLETALLRLNREESRARRKVYALKWAAMAAGLSVAVGSVYMFSQPADSRASEGNGGMGVRDDRDSVVVADGSGSNRFEVAQKRGPLATTEPVSESAHAPVCQVVQLERSAPSDPRPIATGGVAEAIGRIESLSLSAEQARPPSTRAATARQHRASARIADPNGSQAAARPAREVLATPATKAVTPPAEQDGAGAGWTAGTAGQGDRIWVQ